MNTIIVTGCAGFIGSHLSATLLHEGHKVIGIDNFDPFYSLDIKRLNLQKCLDYENFTFYEKDLRDESSVKDIFSNGADIVVHLAGKAGVRPSIADPQSYIENNITATRVVLDAMKTAHIRKLAFASSSSVYGNNPQRPWNENINVDHPISPYAFSKKSCELLNHTWHHLSGFDIINMRFFTVYGPGQRPDLAIHKFTRMMLEGRPLTLFGDGTTARDYTYVSDTVSGIIGVINYLLTHESVFEVLNLGNNQPVSLNDLVKEISLATAISPKIERLPMQPGDVDVTCADIEKAQKMIGYRPQTKLPEGLKEFVGWFKEHYEILKKGV
ncbi:GDP-mannose 4,6-dehydratase [Thermophagus sp. OGC60D27]|uniref:GDP-mannose 4,6-dehydratase n=1 Tax=Thermophagus sp. OGC60D27 TaxID=3458415 RepID=UPI00403806A0